MDLTGNMTAAKVSNLLIGTSITLVGLFLLGVFLRWLLHRLVDRVVSRAEVGVLPDRVSRMSLGRSRAKESPIGGDVLVSTRRVQRAKTMGSLLKSIITGVVSAVIGTMMLSALGVNIAPILASAGVIGLALGFGAQSLVKDFLSGHLHDLRGPVRRRRRRRPRRGQRHRRGGEPAGHPAPRRQRDRLVRPQRRDPAGRQQSQNWARTVLDVSVAYHEDLAKVRRVLQEVAHDLWEDEEFKGQVIEEPEVWGVEALTPDGVTVRVTLKTAPMEQWGVAREMRAADQGPVRLRRDRDPVPPARGVAPRLRRGRGRSRGRPAAGRGRHHPLTPATDPSH